MKKLCPASPLKSAFNQFFHNRPGIQLNNGSESAALVHGIWTDIGEFSDCVFTVDSNLYSEYGRYGRGLFASVHTLNFRQNADGECIDYVRFVFDKSKKTDKICGKFTAYDDYGQRAFFTEDRGIMKIHIFVNKTIPFQILQQFVEVNLVFTAYERRFSK